MKKVCLILAFLAICATTFAGTDLTRSRNLSTTQPVDLYFLVTDGRWNYWRAPATVLADYALGTRVDGVELDIIAERAYVYGYPRVTPVVTSLTNTASIASMDVAGATKSGYRLLHIWVSTNTMGSVSTNNIEALTLSTGTQIEEVTANADYWYITAAAGTVTAVIEATAAGTNYLMVADGAAVKSTAIVFE